MARHIVYQVAWLILFIFTTKLHPIQSLACFKCLTMDFVNDTCRDPFNAIENRFEHDCQATVKGKNGLFPARYCAKISGIIVDIDRNLNRSLLHRKIFLRTCITENIMESSRSSDSTGNFRLKHFAHIDGEIRMYGTISVCSFDGCNRVSSIELSKSLFLVHIFVFLPFF